MNYPGENKLILTTASLMSLVEQTMNQGRDYSEARICVKSVQRVGYDGEQSFTITTDLPMLPAQPTNEEI